MALMAWVLWTSRLVLTLGHPNNHGAAPSAADFLDVGGLSDLSAVAEDDSPDDDDVPDGLRDLSDVGEVSGADQPSLKKARSSLSLSCDIREGIRTSGLKTGPARNRLLRVAQGAASPHLLCFGFCLG